MIPLGNSFVIIHYSGIGVSLSIITWLVGYGFLISARKRVRTINSRYVISISAAIAFIFGTTFSLTFGIGIDESLLSTTRGFGECHLQCLSYSGRKSIENICPFL